MAKFDVGDIVRCPNGRDGTIYSRLGEGCMEVRVDDHRSNNEAWHEDHLLLVRPAKWRMGDIIELVNRPHGATRLTVDNAAVAADFTKEYPPSAGVWSLHERPGVEMWRPGTIAAAPVQVSVPVARCPECNNDPAYRYVGLFGPPQRCGLCFGGEK